MKSAAVKWLLFVIFIVVPIAELAVIIQVGQLVGPLWTMAALIASALLGSWLLAREGRRTWRAFRAALAENRVPTREVADGALVIFGAALMITPGFLTDVTGMLCLFPPTRAMLRRLVVSTVLQRVLVRGGIVPASRGRGRRRGSGLPGGPAQHSRGAATKPPSSRVIEGEVEP